MRKRVACADVYSYVLVPVETAAIQPESAALWNAQRTHRTLARDLDAATKALHTAERSGDPAGIALAQRRVDARSATLHDADVELQRGVHRSVCVRVCVCGWVKVCVCVCVCVCVGVGA